MPFESARGHDGVVWSKCPEHTGRRRLILSPSNLNHIIGFLW